MSGSAGWDPYYWTIQRETSQLALQVHIQNATLAGGVAIGSAANLMIGPGGALAVGVAAGVLSTLGYAYVMPFLEAKIGLRDTCGVHNLHGMPGAGAALSTLLQLQGANGPHDWLILGCNASNALTHACQCLEGLSQTFNALLALMQECLAALWLP